MSTLRRALTDYLAMRRALGYKLTKQRDFSASSFPSSKIAAKNV
jgi:hypothetical protein